MFVRTKIGVDRLARRLGDAGVRVKALHGDMTQGQRDGVMLAFKGGRERLLVATDVAGPRHHGRQPRRELRRAELTGRLRAPHRTHRPRRRVGARGHLDHALQRRDLEAIERHAKTDIEKWYAPMASRGRSRASARPQARRPRHTKPHSRDGIPYAKLIVGPGARQDRAGGRRGRGRRQHPSRRTTTCATCACWSASASWRCRRRVPRLRSRSADSESGALSSGWR